jgi:hypothetical protein
MSLRHKPVRRRAALLLEVLVALTIMIGAMGLLGAQLVNGLKMTGQGDRLTRAIELSDRILALIELDPQTQERVFLDEESEGDFGEQFRGWHWRAWVDETDMDGLGLVNIEILYQANPDDWDQIDGAEVVRAIHLLKADPGRIDLAEDFGVPLEVVEGLLTNFPAFSENGTLDLQALLVEFSSDPLALLEFLNEIQTYLGDAGIGGAGGQVSPDMLQQLLNRFGGGEIDPGALNEALGGQGLENIPAIPAGGAAGGGGRGARSDQ